MHDDEAGQIRLLVELLREFDLDAIRLRVGETEYEVVGREPPAPGALVAAAPAAVTAAAPGPGAADAAIAAAPNPHVKRITAPVVGVYYSAPSPGADPFVAVGDRIAPGQVVCILEAMKLMNEITSDFAGVVTRILPENGELVRLNEELFWIEP